MPHINELTESRYIKKSDLGEHGLLVTFDHLNKENVAGKDQPPEYKQIAYFRENAKGFVLNKTNLGLMAVAAGSENTDHWAGKQVVLYWDPSVMFKGELKGGLRVRKPNLQAHAQAVVAAAAPVAQAQRNDDIPF